MYRIWSGVQYVLLFDAVSSHHHALWLEAKFSLALSGDQWRRQQKPGVCLVVLAIVIFTK